MGESQAGCLGQLLFQLAVTLTIRGPSEPYVPDLQVMGGNSGEDGSGRVGHLNLVSSVQVGDMGSIVFPAARALVSWLEEHGGDLKGVRALELGSGSGVVGLEACALGADVIVTDVEVYTGMIRENIEANQSCLKGKAEARGLDWAEEVSDELKSSIDLLLVSDCVYYEQSLQPLVTTMASLTHPKSTVLLSYEQRPEKGSIYEAFFPLVKKHFHSEQFGQTRSEHGNQVFLIKLTKISDNT